jgi:hypothetical protein
MSFFESALFVAFSDLILNFLKGYISPFLISATIALLWVARNVLKQILTVDAELPFEIK